MSTIKASVIIPTRNRPEKLKETLAGLTEQGLEGEFEIIVVDDGSTPPVSIHNNESVPDIKVVRTEGLERSAARNSGAECARGEVLIFIDDDISVGPGFVQAHVEAQREFHQALAVGAIRLPEELMAKPFPRFRQALEQREVPRARGLVPSRNFCTAANMSIPRQLFFQVGGFDKSMTSSEDQDLALRYTSREGRIVFIPEATAIHRDDALDIRSYCRRAEWGSLQMLPFCERFPDWPDNIDRARVNGPLRPGDERFSASLRKIVKAVLGIRPFNKLLFTFTAILERVAPESAILDRAYRLLLGIHIFRGYRRGLKQVAVSQQRSAGGDYQPMISKPARRTES
jgi:glycosyltransferase involved in cell wall biosynthesis